jgi:hypothetical protein
MGPLKARTDTNLDANLLTAMGANARTGWSAALRLAGRANAPVPTFCLRGAGSWF